jgi:hypothetical protein
LENSSRDPDAERAIAEGLARAPHAVYALVQTALVQDEALRRAHARIEELEGGRPPEEPPRGGFLDNMRSALLGRDERHGSVPSVRPGGLGSSGVWGSGTGASPTGPSDYGQPPMGQSSMGPSGIGPSTMGPSPFGGGGGSFLGTAASAAAGVIGGAMLLNGIRSMFGHSTGSSAFGAGAGGGAPWGGSAANSALAREAGIDHIGGDRSGTSAETDRQASLLDSSQQDEDQDQDQDQDDDDDTDLAGDFDHSDTDTAGRVPPSPGLPTSATARSSDPRASMLRYTPSPRLASLAWPPPARLRPR